MTSLALEGNLRRGVPRDYRDDVLPYLFAILLIGDGEVRELHQCKELHTHFKGINGLAITSDLK